MRRGRAVVLCSALFCICSVYLPASVQGKGGSGGSGGGSGGSSSAGSSGVGGFSSGAKGTTYTAAGKTTGKSWSGSGVTRTASGSRIVYSNGRPRSNRPRMYGGNGGRGPRAMTPRTKMLVAGVAVLWVAGPARYGFYSRQHDCANGRYRFGGSCRECSDTPCPIGQYRVKCTGGSDSYCARCTNNCLKFHDQPGTDAMPKAACLEDSLSPVNLTTSPSACDPNKQPLTCAYTSEGSTEKMAGESLCQIETCCKECESEEEAVERGFGTVCPGSVPTSGTSTHADVAFNLETPGCLGDFNANAPKYKAAIAGLAGYSAGKVDFEWADGIENAGGDETLKCLSGDQRRRSSVPLPSAGVASDGGEVAGGQRREGCAPVEKLPKKDASVLFAVRIKDVPASDIEATWNALTEDAINRALAEKCLHPVRMSQNVEGEPQEEDDPVAKIVGAGVLVICGAAVFLICKFCCGVSSVAAGGGSVWDNVDWDSMPVQYRQHWEVLGWDRNRWQNGAEPASSSLEWHRLTPQQQESAKALGYHQGMWDSDGDPTSWPPLPAPPTTASAPALAAIVAVQYVPPVTYGQPASCLTVAAAEGAAPRNKFCFQCGTQFPAADSKFCASCGTARS